MAQFRPKWPSEINDVFRGINNSETARRGTTPRAPFEPIKYSSMTGFLVANYTLLGAVTALVVLSIIAVVR